MKKEIEIEELILRLADPLFSKQVLEYYTRNSDFLKEFDPERPQIFYTIEHQQKILADEASKANKKESYRFYISKKDEPDKIIGLIGLNNIVWGSFYSCFLGYKLDRDYLNRGYMTQAVNSIVEFAFSELRLHRIEANIMPRNGASLRVMKKCGFEEEGTSKKYLKINGVWEDHIHMVKLNDNV